MNIVSQMDILMVFSQYIIPNKYSYGFDVLTHFVLYESLNMPTLSVPSVGPSITLRTILKRREM